MSIIKQVTLQKIVAHDFQYDPRICKKRTNLSLLIAACKNFATCPSPQGDLHGVNRPSVRIESGGWRTIRWYSSVVSERRLRHSHKRLAPI